MNNWWVALAVESMSFNRWCGSHQGKRTLKRICSRLFVQLQSKQAPSPSVKCKMPTIPIRTSSWQQHLPLQNPHCPPVSLANPLFFSLLFLSPPHTLLNSLRLTPLLLKARHGVGPLFVSEVCVCVCVIVSLPGNLYFCSNPEFLILSPWKRSAVLILSQASENTPSTLSWGYAPWLGQLHDCAV